MEWIPTHKKSPPESGAYLVTLHSRASSTRNDVGKLYYNKDKDRWDTIITGNEQHPLAWMPIPEPYNEKTYGYQIEKRRLPNDEGLEFIYVIRYTEDPNPESENSEWHRVCEAGSVNRDFNSVVESRALINAAVDTLNKVMNLGIKER